MTIVHVKGSIQTLTKDTSGVVTERMVWFYSRAKRGWCVKATQATTNQWPLSHEEMDMKYKQALARYNELAAACVAVSQLTYN